MDNPLKIRPRSRPHSDGKAKLFLIPISVLNLPSPHDYPILEDGGANDLDPRLDISQVDIIVVHLEDEDFRYGDVIQLESFGRYRNDGKYIWDGFNFQNLASEIDEYGHLPSTFQVIEEGYPTDYWADAICHNTIAWINIDKHQSNLLKNYHSTNNSHGFITHFTVNGLKYYMTNGIIKPSDGECCEFPEDGSDDEEFEPVGGFCCDMTEEFFLTTLRKGGLAAVDVSQVNPMILHLVKKYDPEEDEDPVIIYHCN